MLCRPRFMRLFAYFMAVVMVATSLPINLAGAAMVRTDQVVEESALADDRARVMRFMTREDVRRQMIDLGIDPDEARRRAAGLSDQKIQEIAGSLDEQPAGQGVAGAVVGAILVVFLVLLITDLLGLTNVFPFVKSQRVDQ